MASPTGGKHPVTISAWSAVSPFGIGSRPFSAGFHAGDDTATTLDLSEWTVPDARAHLVPGFTAQEALGKKGTRSMDRATGLAVTAVARLLDETPGGRAAATGDGAALVLGTTGGSMRSIADFAQDSLLSERPYLVDPARFPNTVMNCAAGACAIWHGLRGPNTTIAAGRVAGMHALRYAMRLLAGGRARTVLCGGVEEYSATRSWLEWHTRGGDDGTVLGEGCAVFQLTPESQIGSGGRPLADVLAVELGIYTDDPTPVLRACVRRAIVRAGIGPDDVWAVAPSQPGGDLGAREQAVLSVMFGNLRSIRVAPPFGDTAAASVPFQTIAVLALAESTPAASGRIAIITSLDRDGQVGCALLRIR